MANPIIPQHLLQQYRELVQKEKLFQDARMRLRSQLLDLIRHGARVERGTLFYKLTQVPRRQITKDAVVASLGWDAYQTLIDGIQPVFTDRFVIVSASGVSSQRLDMAPEFPQYAGEKK